MSGPSGNTGQPPKRLRCAIYTRKSTSEGLDQEFNTLESQRESAEFFIRAMRHEGWEALPERYDDGGFTGANTDRPALQKLLADIEAGEVDCVVVYKVDRLSRSLLDFAKLLAVFDAKSVGFVSTTQQFNTRDAMGRLTLNILLSFAQFEREMIADRTRDKMGAARRRGKWLGSRPTLGYRGDREKRKLVVMPEEAEQVKKIFSLYLRLGSAGKVAKRINKYGWERKRFVSQNGREHGGGPWSEKDVHMLLRNAVYIGKVNYRGELYEGEHEAIVDEVIFAQVQHSLSEKACGRGKRRGRNPQYLVQGIIFCGLCGQRMTTTASTQGAYRYYMCIGRRERRANTACDHPAVQAQVLEKVVVERIGKLCSNAEIRARIALQMQRSEAEMVEPLNLEQAAIDSRRAVLRAEAERLMDAITNESAGPGSRLLAERLGAVEGELNQLQSQSWALEGKRRALRAEVERVQQTVSILEVFDEAWAAFNDKERQELVQLLVERVEVNEPDGKLEIRFHELGRASQRASENREVEVSA